jgi:hypothetical protein
MHRLYAGIATLAIAAACGGNERRESAAAATGTDSTSPRSACALITAAEAEAILGTAVTPNDESRGAEQSTCEYASADGQYVWLTAYWKGGREQWQLNQTGRTIAGRLMQSEGKEEVEQVMKTEAADALGDQSAFSPILGSLVLKGDVLIEFRLLVGSEERRKWEALARQALSRL